MIYLKSVLAGLVALIVIPVCLLVILVVGMLIYTSVHPRPAEGAIGWDPISIYRQDSYRVLVIPVVIFLAGFLWEYRRLTK